MLGVVILASLAVMYLDAYPIIKSAKNKSSRQDCESFLIITAIIFLTLSFAVIQSLIDMPGMVTLLINTYKSAFPWFFDFMKL